MDQRSDRQPENTHPGQRPAESRYPDPSAGSSPGTGGQNALNNLTGSEWLYFTKSVLTTAYPSAYGHELRKRHGANKPPELMRHLIEFFTKPGDLILDPFAGVGGTLIGAAISRPPRQCVGIEINPRWIEIYDQVIAASRDGLTRYPLIQGDCRQVLREFSPESFDFIATDPPYNIHLARTMCNGKYDTIHKNRSTDYNMHSSDPNDLANLPSYEDYLQAMEEVFALLCRVLKPKKYMAIIVRNAYQNGEYMFTHSDLARRAKKAGLKPKGEIVWYQLGAKLRPYGYPYAYVPNIVHQFIVILRKE